MKVGKGHLGIHIENHATLYHTQKLILIDYRSKCERKTRKVLESNKGKYPHDLRYRNVS